jgi:hypothetical protein
MDGFDFHQDAAVTTSIQERGDPQRPRVVMPLHTEWRPVLHITGPWLCYYELSSTPSAEWTAAFARVRERPEGQVTFSGRLLVICCSADELDDVHASVVQDFDAASRSLDL